MSDQLIELNHPRFHRMIELNSDSFIQEGLDVSLEDVVENMDESFSTCFFRYIDSEEMTDVEIYKKVA